MHRHRPRQGIWRTVVGVCALYALALQAVLGGVAAGRIDARAVGVICAEHVSQPVGEDQETEHDGSCCSLSCQASKLGLTTPSTASFHTIDRSQTRERRWLSLQVNGPPAHRHASANPRAPPVAA